MSVATSLFIALGLAMDCFAVSVACSANQKKIKFLNSLIPALSFGLFQASMFLAGIFIGEGISSFIQVLDHWIAFAILGVIGAKMIVSRKKEDCEEEKCMLTNPYVLLILSIATSIDAFVVGFGMGLLNGGILIPTFIIGFVTFIITILGILTGRKMDLLVERRAQILGGAILIAIGAKILISHLF